MRLLIQMGKIRQAEVTSHAQGFLCRMNKCASCMQVDGYSTRIKPEPKDVEEEEEEGIGDVDLFSLVKEKDELTVNAKWLQHLQVHSSCLQSQSLHRLGLRT
jgi:hypothetical protein